MTKQVFEQIRNSSFDSQIQVENMLVELYDNSKRKILKSELLYVKISRKLVRKVDAQKQK